VTKLEGSNRPQFPFQLASSSFSADPELQGHFKSLCHQVVQILYVLPRENRKKKYYFLDFWFAHANFLLPWRLWCVPLLTLPRGFRDVRKSGPVSSRSSISADKFSTRFLFLIQILWNHLHTHTLLMFKSCVKIMWTINSLILSSSAITGIAKLRSWRMKALTYSTFLLVLAEAGRSDRVSSSTVSCSFTKS
jgi:hypothetical protein